MELTPMRYKDYTWPYNPERCTLRQERKLAVHKVPFGRYSMQDLGVTCRVMRGEGTFTGPGAYEEFRRLAQVFDQQGAGLLVHPVWRTMNAYFVTLELQEEPQPDYVRYTFTFWEDGGTERGFSRVESQPQQSEVVSVSGAASAVYHTVKKGDTLWGIARSYGVTLESLIRSNPQIRNPNLIYPGDRVRVR